MKTRFLIFEGDPMPYLSAEVMTKMDRDPVKIVRIGKTLHCIQIPDNIMEEMIIGQLRPGLPDGKDLFLINPSDPYAIIPKQPKHVMDEVARMFAESDDGTAICEI
ncbi:hypothetical protein GC207_00045 [bacterium]|nr:hypothetical protein [bacterium]